MSLNRFLFGGSPEAERVQQEQLSGVSSLLQAGREDLQSARSSGLPETRRQYLSNLFSDEPEAMERFAQPYMRQYQQDVLPQLAERAAAGGGLRSTGFQNQLQRSGMELQERISGAREQARLGALQHLTSDYDNAFNRYRQMSMQPIDASQYGGRGFVGGALNFLSESGIANTLAKAGVAYVTGAPGQAAASVGMDLFQNLFASKEPSKPLEMEQFMGTDIKSTYNRPDKIPFPSDANWEPAGGRSVWDVWRKGFSGDLP